MHVALKALLETCPQVRGGRVVFHTDNQGAYSNVLRMRGNPDTFEQVREFRLLAATHDVLIVTEWRPRTDAAQIIADHWSKVVTGSERMLVASVVQEIMVEMRQLTGLQVNIDLFASTWSTVVHGAFFSMFWCVGTLGVDAMAQQWSTMPGAQEPMVAWVDPPVHLVASALRRLIAYRTNAVVLLPGMTDLWKVLLAQMPLAGTRVVKKGKGVYMPCPHVPWRKQDSAWQMRYDLQVCYVHWQ
jgi:hypothetical protein